MKHLVFNTLLIGTIAIGMAVSARASVSYNLTGSGFTSPTAGTIIDSNDDIFQLVYDDSGSSPETVATFPTNIAYGTITMECVGSCTSPVTDTFGSFTVVIDVNDTTDGGTGQFIGTSAGGTVTFTPGAPSTSSSTIQIDWQAPTTLSGAGFGNNTFTVQSFTPVEPLTFNSGVSPIFGTVDETAGTTSATPEPPTMALLGIGLLGLGWRRAAKA
jgi:hypothetical protein